jgi:alkylated DNA repair dioxygenase AlkB
MPEFLVFIRARAEAFAGIAPRDFQQVLITEYGPGAGIGWHKDRSVFGEVLGISLLSSSTFRLRRKAGNGWERRKLIAEPQSAYLLRGPSRTEWEHSIPAVMKLPSPSGTSSNGTANREPAKRLQPMLATFAEKDRS